MDDIFNDVLNSWQNFYFMIGGAAAGLMGLMFVALSLGMNLVNDEIRAGFAPFVTPSILYFSSVILVAGVMLVPAYAPLALAAILFLGGLVSFSLTMQHVRRLISIAKRLQDFGRWNWLSQIILPIVGHSLIVLAGVGFAFNQSALAFTGLWLSALVLLICAISNTWGLVIWIINERGT